MKLYLNHKSQVVLLALSGLRHAVAAGHPVTLMIEQWHNVKPLHFPFERLLFLPTITINYIAKLNPTRIRSRQLRQRCR